MIGEFSVEFFDQFSSDFCGFFQSGVSSVEFRNAIRGYPYSPFSSVRTPVHTLDARLIGRASFPVVHILTVRSFTQVGDPIIGEITVNVVHTILWPSAVMVEPRKPVSDVSLLIYRDLTFSCTWREVISSLIADFDLTLFSNDLPREDAGFWIIMKDFLKTIQGQAILQFYRRCHLNISQL